MLHLLTFCYLFFQIQDIQIKPLRTICLKEQATNHGTPVSAPLFGETSIIFRFNVLHSFFYHVSAYLRVNVHEAWRLTVYHSSYPKQNIKKVMNHHLWMPYISM